MTRRAHLYSSKERLHAYFYRVVGPSPFHFNRR